MSEENFEGEVVEDVEIYEGEPDNPGPMVDEHGTQDDEIAFGGLGFFAKSSTMIRDREETLQWYATHQTASQIGFDPDGQCLKVVRTARNIGPMFPTAKQAQDGTPAEHRVLEVRNLRASMPLYYDDPRDSNRAGHVVTMIGRVRDFNPDSLGDILLETNTVKTNEVVVVRGDYFAQHWGDTFQFGARWLNGHVLDVTREPKFASKIDKFNSGGPVFQLNLLARAGEDRPAAKTTFDLIMRQVNQLPDTPKARRVREFKEKARSKEKILDMGLLDEAVRVRGSGPSPVRAIRDEIRRLINALPDE